MVVEIYTGRRRTRERHKNSLKYACCYMCVYRRYARSSSLSCYAPSETLLTQFLHLLLSSIGRRECLPLPVSIKEAFVCYATGRES